LLVISEILLAKQIRGRKITAILCSNASVAKNKIKDASLEKLELRQGR